jgi:ATP-dependent Lon protease
MKQTRKVLDDTVYGLVDTKVQLMRIIAQWITNPTSNGNCIGIQGPAGVGKTSLIKDGLSKALNVPCAFVALGGATDGSFLDGYSYTYEGSRHGKIAEILLKTKCNNPIIFFDELDKVSSTNNGEEIISVLTHITDSSQNNEFNDKYFGELNIDLSRCIFIFSYNDESLLNPILKDRMITINASGYSKKEKLIIAKDYIIPTILKTFERNCSDIVFSDTIIEKIIDIVPREEGVRNLKRGIESVVSWINMYL